MSEQEIMGYKMNTITINGEKIDVKDLSIDFNNNEIHIIEDDISSESYSFLIKHIIMEKNIDELVYLKDNKDNIYSFYKCYIGKHCLKDAKVDVIIKFNAYITNFEIKDIKNYKINKMEVRLEYKKFNIVQIEESIGKLLEFSIGNMNYCIELVFGERYYKITLENSKKMETEKFIHKFLQLYEFLILNLGYYLEINKIKLFDFEKVCEYHYPFSSKYSGINNYNDYNCVLGKINKREIKEIYKNWLKLRKNTHNIYDIFINVFSVKYFIEIALSTITNCMEGYYKCMHKTTLKKTIKDKFGKPKMKGKDFKDIMKEYLNSNEGKIIFSSKERQVLKIYTKLTNHRNYFAHLDKKKKRFYGDSNLYMLLKIKLLFRAFMLKDINQTIESDDLQKSIKKIEENIDWKKGA